MALSAAAWARVVLAARQLDKLEQVAAEIRSTGRETFIVPIDLSSQDSIKEAFSKASKEFGRIDILVNNADITRDGLAPPHEARRLGCCTQNQSHRAPSSASSRQMAPMIRERWGRIVNITSVVAEAGNAYQATIAPPKPDSSD